MKAVVAKAKGVIELDEVSAQDVKQMPTYVQVRNQYVALNPSGKP